MLALGKDPLAETRGGTELEPGKRACTPAPSCRPNGAAQDDGFDDGAGARAVPPEVGETEALTSIPAIPRAHVIAFSVLAVLSAAERGAVAALAGETGVVPGRVGVEDELPNNCGENPIGKVFGTAAIEDCEALASGAGEEGRGTPCISGGLLGCSGDCPPADPEGETESAGG